MATDHSSVVRNAVDAVNSGKPEAAEKLFGPALARKVAESVKMMRTAFPDLQYTIDHIETHGDHVTFAYSVKGTHRGQLGTIAATNKEAHWHGAGVAVIENGIIAHVHTLEDWVRLGLQLGVRLVNPTMNGTWVGSSGSTSVTLTLTQNGTAVSGTAKVSGLPDTFPLNGTNNFPNVSLSGSVFGLQVTFNGAFNGPNAVAGTLTVQGFPPQLVTITRQS
jgi:predicted ester cyclase